MSDLLKCKSCGRVLEIEEVKTVYEVMDTEGAREYYSVCGHCGSNALEDYDETEDDDEED